MLKLEESAPVTLPNYIICDSLNKKTLIKECLNDSNLKLFLPDSNNLNAIDRQFFLTVIK